MIYHIGSASPWETLSTRIVSVLDARPILRLAYSPDTHPGLSMTLPQAGFLDRSGSRYGDPGLYRVDESDSFLVTFNDGGTCVASAVGIRAALRLLDQEIPPELEALLTSINQGGTMYYEYPQTETPQWPPIVQVVDFTEELAFIDDDEICLADGTYYFDAYNEAARPDFDDHGHQYVATPGEPFVLVLSNGARMMTSARGVVIYFTLTGQIIPAALSDAMETAA